MTCRYELEVTGRCPVDPATTDTYRVVIHAVRMSTVESILEIVERVTAEPIYQEHLTQTLADELCADVVTFGAHSGVKTRCTAEPAKRVAARRTLPLGVGGTWQ